MIVGVKETSFKNAACLRVLRVLIQNQIER